MENNKKGFTLAELLIVVAMIAVLVAIAIPVFNTQLEKSRQAVDMTSVRNGVSLAMSEYVLSDDSSTSGQTTVFYYDQVNNKVVTALSDAKKIQGYGKSSSDFSGVMDVAYKVSGIPNTNNTPGIVEIGISNLTHQVEYIKWTKNEITTVDNKNIQDYITEDGSAIVLKPDGLAIINLQQGSLQGISSAQKSKITSITFAKDNDYPEDEGRNGATGYDFTGQFNGYSNVTTLDLSGISIGKINLEDWKQLTNLNQITLPTNITGNFNIPGQWYYTDSNGNEHAVVNDSNDRSLSRIWTPTDSRRKGEDLSGVTIYKK